MTVHRTRFDLPPTPGQLEYLQLVARGKLVKEIAFERNMRFNGIVDQLTIARKRLGARSTAHAVAIALSRGLISLENSK